MNLAYIISPYRATGFWNKPVLKWFKIAWNIHKARKLALKFWLQGYAVICPQSNTAFFDGKATDEVWLKGDIELMRHCDAVVLGKGWEKSAGCKKEVHEAEYLELEILSE